jgi:hypothetical protein
VQAPRLGGRRACRRQESSPNSWCRLGTGRPGQHHNAADPPSCRAVGWCEHCRLTVWLESLRIVPWGGVAPAALIFVVPAFGHRHQDGEEGQGLRHNEFYRGSPRVAKNKLQKPPNQKIIRFKCSTFGNDFPKSPLHRSTVFVKSSRCVLEVTRHPVVASFVHTGFTTHSSRRFLPGICGSTCDR